jgi:hypothetical protein
MPLKLMERIIDSETRTANATLLADHLVMADADPVDVIVCTANARALGVVQVGAVDGDPVCIVTQGVVPVMAGGIIAAGDDLISDATGHVVAAAASGVQNLVGIAWGAAAGAGVLVPVKLFPTSRYAEPTGGGIGNAVITVGAEVAHAVHSITCNIQLKDNFGADLAVVGVVQAYLSDDAAGKDVSTLVPTTDLAAGTDGALIVEVANKKYTLISEADGDIDVVLIKTDGADTCYLNIVLPNGKIVTSGAITFSA